MNKAKPRSSQKVGHLGSFSKGGGVLKGPTSYITELWAEVVGKGGSLWTFCLDAKGSCPSTSGEDSTTS